MGRRNDWSRRTIPEAASDAGALRLQPLLPKTISTHEGFCVAFSAWRGMLFHSIHAKPCEVSLLILLFDSRVEILDGDDSLVQACAEFSEDIADTENFVFIGKGARHCLPFESAM